MLCRPSESPVPAPRLPGQAARHYYGLSRISQYLAAPRLGAECRDFTVTRDYSRIAFHDRLLKQRAANDTCGAETTGFGAAADAEEGLEDDPS